MHSGAEQTSLWEQSDLLDLVAPAESGNPARAERGATNTASRDGVEASAARPAGTAPVQESAAPQRRAVAAYSPFSPPGEPSAASCAVSAGDREAEERPDAASAQAWQAEASSARPPSAEPHLPASATPASAATAEPAPRAGSAANGRLETRGPDPDGAPGPPAAAALPACPQRLLILDTETTALSPQQGQCIEVGAVLFDVASRSVLMQVSFLLPCDDNPAQAVNGIPAAVSRLQQPWRSGLACFEAMVDGADALLAHNVSFDRQWFGSGDLPPLDKPWICSMEDIRWPEQRRLRATPSVRDLALAYGVPVWEAHRALTDCIYLVQVFQRCEELEPLLQAALEPRRLVRARLSYDERQLAKDAGFRWNEPVPKAWSRRLSEREIAALPFAVDPVEAEEPAPHRRETNQALWRRSA